MRPISVKVEFETSVSDEVTVTLYRDGEDDLVAVWDWEDFVAMYEEAKTKRDELLKGDKT